MKSLQSLLVKRKIEKKTELDDKTVFYVFKKIIKEEFGNIGIEKLQPDYYSAGKLFIKSESSAWLSELWMNKEKIIRKINQEIGQEEIKDIKTK